MGNYQVVITGHKDEMAVNKVLNNLAVLFKCNPEQLRPLLASKKFIAKRSLELEVAKKYQKAIEDTGCIAIIESELVFDDPELAEVNTPEEPLSSDHVVEQGHEFTNSQVENTAAASNSSAIFQSENAYYTRKFEIFDAEGGVFKPTFNGYALLFGGFWYVYKGLWAKGFFMLIACFIFAGIPAPIFWLYCAIAGNYDYYLLRRYKTQLWANNGTPSKRLKTHKHNPPLSTYFMRCKFCGTEISETLNSCHKCGAKVPKKSINMGFGMLIFWTIAGLMILLLVGFFIQSYSKSDRVHEVSTNTRVSTTADEMLKRASELSHSDDARIAQQVRSNCANMLEKIRKGMQENETNPHEDSKSYLAKVYIDQISEYKRICER